MCVAEVIILLTLGGLTVVVRQHRVSAHVALSTTSHHCGRRSARQAQSTCSCRTKSRWRVSHSVSLCLPLCRLYHSARLYLRGHSHIATALRVTLTVQPEQRKEKFGLLPRDFTHSSVTLEVGPDYCERMGPLLLSVALCLSAAVPQRVKGERNK